MATSQRVLLQRASGAMVLIVLLGAAPIATAKTFTPWGPAALEVGINSPQADGCPIESPNGRDLFFASTRPGAVGGMADPNDIWMAHRRSIDAPWGPAVHLPEPVNSAAADFCPTPLNGNRLYFVSSRAEPGACGAGDIYRTRKYRNGNWREPRNLGCYATGDGPNFAGGEFSPSLVHTEDGVLLYFSSTGPDGLDQDIYVSRMGRGGSFGPARVVPELSTPANDQMPNVSRNGREIVFSSDRSGGLGSFDVYTAHRSSTDHAWSTPINLGANVNTSAAETRPSLSGDGKRLHLGRLGDIWVSVRTRMQDDD